jgi:hypothetical protein
MSQYSKPFRIQLLGQYAQAGENRVFESLYVNGLSAGCPDARSIAQLDGCGIPYERIPWHDPDDVAALAAAEDQAASQRVEIATLKSTVESLRAEAGQLDAALLEATAKLAKVKR